MNFHCKGIAWFTSFLVLVLIIPGFGQINEGTVVGTVRDSTGAAIPAATVTLTNVATNVETTTVTSHVGEYIITNTIPGRYTVVCTLKGFRREVFTELIVRSGTSSRVDFTLQPGELQQEMTVTSEAPLLQTENAGVGTTLSNSMVAELPLKGRLALNLAFLEAGVFRPAPGTSASKATQLQGGGGLSAVISGVREHYNNYSLDGTTIYNNQSGYLGYSPSIDALDEVRIDTSNNNARQGRVAGGTVAFTTRAGTNTLHGSFFEFLKNDLFDALNWGAPAPKPAYRYNQFGFVLSGPVYIPKIYNGRNRTFFMINYEGLRVRNLGSAGAIVPTALEKQGIFTGGPPVIDPVTGSPFANNVIPPGRINSIATNLLAYYPDPNTFGNPRYNYVSNGSAHNNVDQVNLRIDHKISSKDTIFYSMANQPTLSIPINVLAGIGTTTNGTLNKDTVSYTHVFSPTIINNARVGFFGNASTTLGFRAYKEDVWTIVGLAAVAPRVVIPPIAWGIPTTNILGYDSLSELGGGSSHEQQYDFYDDFTWVRGKHVLQFGGSFLREYELLDYPLYSTPTMSVDGRYTGTPMADFLLGDLSFTDLTQGTWSPKLHQNHFGVYFQDDWHATSKLTLNLGLRYEYNSPVVERYNKIAGWDLKKGKLIYPGEVSAGVVAPYRKDLSPRVGFAYRVKDKTVVRAAYGVYWNTEFGVQSNQGYNPPFLQYTMYPAAPTIPNITLADPFPLALGQVPISYPQVLNDYMKDGYIQQWNLTVERTLPWNSILTVAYVGNKGTRLPWFGVNPNATPPGPGDYQSRKPYPEYGGIYMVDSIGGSTYHALQVRWDRRFAEGLLIRANYTWSKSMILGDDSLYNPGSGFSNVQDQTCLKCEKGVALYDVPHKFLLTYVWQLPPKNLKGFVGHALGGWELSGTTVFQSGTPYTITAPLALPNGDNAVRPNLVGDWHVSEKTWDRQFNTAAFETPAIYTLGNLGRDTQRMGGLNQFDVGLLKTFLITERHRLQFRAEFYNLFNHPTFGMPDRGLGDPLFGLVLKSLQPARTIEFGLKYSF